MLNKSITTLWTPGNETLIAWVHKFKQIFIQQNKNSIDSIFNRAGFGQHNGCSLDEYCDYEFNEFQLKCDKFDLTMDALVECYQLKDNFFYFSLGKKSDKAVFEAIFKWDSCCQLAIGNGYYFKIEPKTQFIKSINSNNSNILRRINITPKPTVVINAVIQREPGEDFVFNKIEVAPHLGGRFYSIQYQRENDSKLSFWDDIKVATNNGVINQSVLMRGEDHPLFISNLYPDVRDTTVTIQPDIFPVVVYILFTDGEEVYMKYPLENKWEFNKSIKKVCLTDTLSFDWIVENY